MNNVELLGTFPIEHIYATKPTMKRKVYKDEYGLFIKHCSAFCTVQPQNDGSYKMVGTVYDFEEWKVIRDRRGGYKL